MAGQRNAQVGRYPEQLALALGERLAVEGQHVHTIWNQVAPIAGGIAAWIGFLLVLTLIAPRAILKVNDATRAGRGSGLASRAGMTAALPSAGSGATRRSRRRRCRHWPTAHAPDPARGAVNHPTGGCVSQ